MTTKSKKNPRKSDKTPLRSAISTLAPEWLESEMDLSGTSRPNRLLKLLRGKKSKSTQSSLGWSLSPGVDSEKLAQVNCWHNSLIQKKNLNQVAEEIFAAVDDALGEEIDDGDALTLLMACHAVRAIAGRCEFNKWQGLVSRLLEFSNSAASDVALPVRKLHLSVEIPLTLAYQIPEIEDYQQLAAISCQEMAGTITEMLDHDGWPHARYLADFGPLVASWTRCQLMVFEMKLEEGFESASQLEWVVRQLFRMLRPDRTLVFSNPDSIPVAEEFLDRVLELSIDPEDKRLRKAISPAVKGTSKPRYESPVETSNLSEWSESAVLQSRWSPNTPKLAVDFSKDRSFVEICRDVVLIQGDANPEITINGVVHDSNEPFDVACTESDEDIEYLELQKDLGNGVTLTRQFLLSRSEEVLLIADMVVPDVESRIDYRTQWPLARGVEVVRETETREIYLVSKSIQALVLPLALPEWKVGRTDDSLLEKDGALCLTQSANGRGLYAPLFFDLNPKRSKKKRTWRQLTVGEQLDIIPKDVACAYRVQIDKLQWVFYRAISSIGNRTFIGENVNCEFTLSRFKKGGSTELLIEI